MSPDQAPRIASRIKLMAAERDGRQLAKRADGERQALLTFWHQERRRLRYWTRHMCGPFFARPLPDRLRGVTCGAKTRSGPCTHAPISQRNGRCKAHGGLSTGPRSAQGKAQALANLGDHARGGQVGELLTLA